MSGLRKHVSALMGLIGTEKLDADETAVMRRIKRDEDNKRPVILQVDEQKLLDSAFYRNFPGE